MVVALHNQNGVSNGVPTLGSPAGHTRARTNKGRSSPAQPPLSVSTNGVTSAHAAADPSLTETELTALGHRQPGQLLDHDLAATILEPVTHPVGPRDPLAHGQGVTLTSPPDAPLPDLRRTAPTRVVPGCHHGPAGGRAPRGHSAAGRHPGAASRPHTPDRARRDTRC